MEVSSFLSKLCLAHFANLLLNVFTEWNFLMVQVGLGISGTNADAQWNLVYKAKKLIGPLCWYGRLHVQKSTLSVFNDVKSPGQSFQV